MKKNLFEGAYFGKPFMTRDGRKAIFSHTFFSKEDNETFVILMLPNKNITKENYNCLNTLLVSLDGTWHEKKYSSPNDIISEWSEDPIICCKCQWDNYYDYRIVFSHGEGHVRVSFFADEIIISDLYISEKFKNKGYATALLDKVDEILNGKPAKISPLQEWQKEWYLKRGYLIYQEESVDEEKLEELADTESLWLADVPLQERRFKEGYKAGYRKAYEGINTTKEEKQIIIDKACEIFADIINEVLNPNASDMPYIKKFRKAMEDE